MTHDFFKSFASLTYFISIWSGSKNGEPTVTYIKTLFYSLQKQSTTYQLRLSENWAILLLLRNDKQIATNHLTLLQLHMGKIKIT